MKSEIIEKIKLRIDKNRNYRENQIKFFVPLAKNLIGYVMTSNDTDKKDIEQFFRIFNVSGNYDLIRGSIKKLKISENKKKDLLNYVDSMEKHGSTGFTKSARNVIPGFKKADLIKLKSIFSKIIKLSEDYKNLPIFSELVKELYEIHGLKNELSVWLNYIKPKIFPMISGSGRSLFEDMGYDCSWSKYSELILKVPEITSALGEPNFGIVDAAGFDLDDEKSPEAEEFNNAQLRRLIKSYAEFRGTERWKELEQYKWDYINKHKNIFDNLNDLQNKIRDLGSPNIISFWGRQGMFKHLANEETKNFELELENLFNPNRDIYHRIENFIEKTKEILTNSKEWHKKDSVNPGIESVSFLLFIKDPKRYLLYTKVSPYNKFAKHLDLGKEFTDNADPIKRYLSWQNYCGSTLIPIMKTMLNRPVDLLDCQDFIYCLSEHLHLFNGGLENDQPVISNGRSFPKNLILYGPPGTGKTFITKQKAVEIIEDG